MNALSDIKRFVGRYSLGRDGGPFDIKGSPHFLRVKVPGGFLTSQQFRRIAELTSKYSKERAEITNRQDIQLHWIEAEDSLDIFAVLEQLGFTTDMCGQSFSGTRYGDTRNIICCPTSGIEQNEIMNGYPLMKELTDFFIGNPNFQDMPRKFKFSISGCGSDCTRAYTNDLALVAVKKAKDTGFTLLVGGSAGSSLPGPRLAEHTNLFINPEDAFDVAVATIELHRDFGNRESKAKARFKWLIENWGINKFRTKLQEKMGKRFKNYTGPVFSKNSDHERIQPQSQRGCYYIHLPLLDGRLTSNEMISIADFADEYGSGELRLTPTQNIIIPNIKRSKEALRELRNLGFSLDGSKLRWNSMGCSSDFCGKTIDIHAKKITQEIIHTLETNFTIDILNAAGLRIHTSGCANNCCANMIAELGLGGRIYRIGEKSRQAYDVILGGGFGTEPRFGKLISKKVPAEEISQKINSLLRCYVDKRKPREDFKTFCKRQEIEELKILLDTYGD